MKIWTMKQMKNETEDKRIFISRYDMLSLLYLLLNPKEEGRTSSDVAKAVYKPSPSELNSADSASRKRLKRYNKLGLVHRVSKFPCKYIINNDRVKYGFGPLIIGQKEGEGWGINLGRYIAIINLEGFVVIRPVQQVWGDT